MANHKASPRFSAEVRMRALRMVLEHRTEHTSQWAAIASIAAKIGCTGQTLPATIDYGRALIARRDRLPAGLRRSRSISP